jgi:hypothetical protein
MVLGRRLKGAVLLRTTCRTIYLLRHAQEAERSPIDTIKNHGPASVICLLVDSALPWVLARYYLFQLRSPACSDLPEV